MHHAIEQTSRTDELFSSVSEGAIINVADNGVEGHQ